MKSILVFLLKATIILLLLPLLWVSLVLNMVPEPVFFFSWSVFLQAMSIPVFVAAVVGISRRSATPILWALFCCAFTGFIIIFPGRSSLFILPFVTAGIISFFYRNKITEPMLVMLPIAAGTNLLINWIYAPYLMAWGYYTAGLKTLPDAALLGLLETKERLLFPTLVIPLLLVYFLGKHGYISLYKAVAARWPRPAAAV